MKSVNWDSITITNKLMFGEVFRNADLCRQLLELVLGVGVEKVIYTHREHDILPELGAKGIRMDVYVKDGKGTVFDVEMQNENRGNLEKRSRYYLSTNDMDCIKAGDDYRQLRDSFVIFICTFDPFGRGLARYTVTPRCKEDMHEMVDGSTRLFINAAAWDSCDDPELRSFLCYLMGGTIEPTDFTEQIEAEVRRVREAPEWRRTAVRLIDYINEERNIAREEAREEGLIEGRAEGREEGREETTQQIARLFNALKDTHREDELGVALSDKEKLRALLDEFGIE